MNVLFLHPNFPSQFRDLAAALAAHPRNKVAFITARKEGEIPGIQKILHPPPDPPPKGTHPYLASFDQAIRHGQAAYRAALELRKSGFVPDVIYAHSGFGQGLFLRDLFPNCPLLFQFEWYYRAHGSDSDFDPSEPLDADGEARIRVKNAAILTELDASTGGCTPTKWQKAQFPREFHSKIGLCHEGINTEYFSPEPSRLSLPRIGLELPEDAEIVTYVARGMEPYRGFPQFIDCAHRLLEARPKCHIVVVGDDRVAYGRPRPDGKSYKTAMLEEFPLDPARTHFTGMIPYSEYRQVLRASSAHVYLTRPFVLSWSALEAMACGCVVIGSDTAPVREIIADGHNGILVDFFNTQAMAERTGQALDAGPSLGGMRENARATVLERYALSKLLPARARWLQRAADRKP